MLRALVLISATLLCVSALACEPGQREVFSCTLDNGKQIQVCQAPDRLTYVYGTPAKTDLALSQPNDTARELSESSASGVNNSFFFANGEDRYIVEHMVDPIDGRLYDAFLISFKTGVQSSENNSCKEGTVRFNKKAITAKPNEANTLSRD